MSRTYDLELSCGCLIGTADDIYMPCMTNKCVADKEYFHKDVGDSKQEVMEINVKKDRLEINKIIENCLPLIKLNKRMTQECADAILVYFIEKTANKPEANK